MAIVETRGILPPYRWHTAGILSAAIRPAGCQRYGDFLRAAGSTQGRSHGSMSATPGIWRSRPKRGAAPGLPKNQPAVRVSFIAWS